MNKQKFSTRFGRTNVDFTVYADQSVFFKARLGYTDAKVYSVIAPNHLVALRDTIDEVLGQIEAYKDPHVGQKAFDELEVGAGFRWVGYNGPFFTKVSNRQYWVPQTKQLIHRDDIGAAAKIERPGF